MSPPRRRSARLASSTPKRKATPLLSSVNEGDEPQRCEPQIFRGKGVIQSSPAPSPATPVSSAVKPPRSEMHPSKYHATMGAPSSALSLGFTDIKPLKEGEDPRLGALNATPSKISGAPSSSFDFRAAQQAPGFGLSGHAQRMMEELRDEASKIKADLVAQREAEGHSIFPGRTFAKPKGRFSAAHTAEFDKMESIEGHASAWRAQEGRFTPVKSLKRSPSKANLDGTPTSVRSIHHQSPSKIRIDGTPTSVRSIHYQSPSKTGIDDTPNKRIKPSLKRTSSVANLDSAQRPTAVNRTRLAASVVKPRLAAREYQFSPVKRLKQNEGDDTSTARPKPNASSSITRARSTRNEVAALPKSQSQSSLMRLPGSAKSVKSHVPDTDTQVVSLVSSPSKSNIGKLAKSATLESLASPARTADFKRRIISPGRFQKVKSILRGQKTDSDSGKTAIPLPAAQVLRTSQTPAARRTEKELPPLPLTTPRRKLTKRVTFTPDTNRGAVMQETPSPKKAGIFKGFAARLAEARYAGLDSVMAQADSGDVVYPDLSGLQHLIEPDAQVKQPCVPAVPGSFSFRSDHTIRFGGVASAAFGSSPGQSSIRQVRASAMPVTDMPGSFPVPPSPSTHPNKENKAPPPPSKMLPGVPHGMSNKKRHRASSNDEDGDDERASKKRKNEQAPEGHDVVAHQLVGTTPRKILKARRPATLTKPPSSGTPGRSASRTPGRTPIAASSASPTKKAGGLSMSRLNMLARPKNRA